MLRLQINAHSHHGSQIPGYLPRGFNCYSVDRKFTSRSESPVGESDANYQAFFAENVTVGPPILFIQLV